MTFIFIELISCIGMSQLGDAPAKQLKLGSITLHKLSHLQIMGPNGSGKSTLLEAIYTTWEKQRKGSGKAGSLGVQEKPPIEVNANAIVGYYRQDFNNLDPRSTAIQCLQAASGSKHSEQDIRRYLFFSFYCDINSCFIS